MNVSRRSSHAPVRVPLDPSVRDEARRSLYTKFLLTRGEPGRGAILRQMNDSDAYRYVPACSGQQAILTNVIPDTIVLPKFRLSHGSGACVGA